MVNFLTLLLLGILFDEGRIRLGGHLVDVVGVRSSVGAFDDQMP
jgi:hypothetical protein